MPERRLSECLVEQRLSCRFIQVLHPIKEAAKHQHIGLFRRRYLSHQFVPRDLQIFRSQCQTASKFE